MKKRISRLHYITQDHPDFSHEQLVQKACESGIDWVQLRAKNKSDEELYKIATSCKKICSEYNVTFIINDHVTLAKELDLDGVHLGLSDMKIDDARKILGTNKLIGGTANSIRDIELQHSRSANYIGLGPFRFTSTKENLSPIIGLETYKKAFLEVKSIPIIAIGGITTSDLSQLMSTGIYGVAVASEISFAKNMAQKILEFGVFNDT
jgi:thiamine-phosphate pyrophosphorylase